MGRETPLISAKYGATEIYYSFLVNIPDADVFEPRVYSVYELMSAMGGPR